MAEIPGEDGDGSVRTAGLIGTHGFFCSIISDSKTDTGPAHHPHVIVGNRDTFFGVDRDPPHFTSIPAPIGAGSYLNGVRLIAS